MHGLGVVFLGIAPSGKLSDLTETANSENLSRIQGTFASMSDDVLQDSRIGEIIAAISQRDGVLKSRIWKNSKPRRDLNSTFTSAKTRPDA